MEGIFNIHACAGKLNIRNAWNSWSNENASYKYIGQAVCFCCFFSHDAYRHHKSSVQCDSYYSLAWARCVLTDISTIPNIVKGTHPREWLKRLLCECISVEKHECVQYIASLNYTTPQTSLLQTLICGLIRRWSTIFTSPLTDHNDLAHQCTFAPLENLCFGLWAILALKACIFECILGNDMHLGYL